MVDKRVVEYVNSALKSGFRVEDIKVELLKQGWSENDVNQAISMAQGSLKEPKKPEVKEVKPQEKKEPRKEVKPKPGGKPEVKPAVKTGRSYKYVYIVGLVMVILIIGVTAYYISFVLELDLLSGQVRICGNDVCDPGETFETCPADCKQEAPSGPIIVSVSPETKSVNNSETFTLEMKIEGVSDLYGFQFDVVYDKNILEFQGASQGTFLNRNIQDQTYCIPYNNEIAGLVKYIACTRLGEGSVDGKGVIGTVTFKAVGTGRSLITLSNIRLGNNKIERLNSSVLNGEVVVL